MVQNSPHGNGLKAENIGSNEWGRTSRGVPEVDPDTQGRNNPCARAWTKVLALLFERREALIRMRKAPLGMLVNYMLITPRDDCPIQKVMQLAMQQDASFTLHANEQDS